MMVTGQDPSVPYGSSFLPQFSSGARVVGRVTAGSRFLPLSLVFKLNRLFVVPGLAAIKATWDHPYVTLSEKDVFIHGLN